MSHLDENIKQNRQLEKRYNRLVMPLSVTIMVTVIAFVVVNIAGYESGWFAIFLILLCVDFVLGAIYFYQFKQVRKYIKRREEQQHIQDLEEENQQLREALKRKSDS